MGSNHRGRWILPLLLAVTVIGMGRLCVGEFTWWDDRLTLFQNPRLNPPSWAGVQYYWTHAFMGLYVPVTYTAWSGLAAVAGVQGDESGIALNPWVFHGANVLLHLANVVLVYRILTLLVRRPWAACAGALVFGVHPVQVEAVGWASGMKDVLGGTFVFGAVWQYLVFAHDARAGTRGGTVHYWVGAALMVLGILSKPTAVVTPAIVGALDLLVLGRDWRQVVRSAGGYFLLAVPGLVWTKLAQAVPALAPVWARPLIAGDAVAFYLGKLVWPVGLAIDYGRSPARVMSGAGWWATCLVPVSIGIGLWAGRRRAPALLAAGIVFVVGLMPVLGWTPFMFQYFSTVADHYLYLSMLGVGLASAWVVARWPRRWTTGIVAVVVAMLAARSVVQAGTWGDSMALFGHALAVNPDSSVGHEHMASELESRASRDPVNGPAMLAEAEGHLREAVRLRPGTFMTHYNLALLLIKEGDIHGAIGPLSEGIGFYDPKVDAADLLGRAHHLLGAALWQDGRKLEGLSHFEKATEAAPGSAEYRATYASAARALKKAGTRPTGN